MKQKILQYFKFVHRLHDPYENIDMIVGKDIFYGFLLSIPLLIYVAGKLFWKLFITTVGYPFGKLADWLNDY